MNLGQFHANVDILKDISNIYQEWQFGLTEVWLIM